ncbi:hypothetical protein, partial [Pseudochrobactrum kiredjianiae]
QPNTQIYTNQHTPNPTITTKTPQNPRHIYQNNTPTPCSDSEIQNRSAVSEESQSMLSYSVQRICDNHSPNTCSPIYVPHVRSDKEYQ